MSDIGYAGPTWDSLWEDFYLLRLEPANIGLALGLSGEEVRAGLAAAEARVEAMLPEKRQQRRTAALLRRPGSIGSGWGSSAGYSRS